MGDTVKILSNVQLQKPFVLPRKAVRTKDRRFTSLTPATSERVINQPAIKYRLTDIHHRMMQHSFMEARCRDHSFLWIADDELMKSPEWNCAIADLRNHRCCPDIKLFRKLSDIWLQQQQNAYAALERQFNDWQSQRHLLAQRLDTLKARFQTQALASETDSTVFNNADLARATELADQIERELRIGEAQQALRSDPADSLLSREVTSTDDVEAEVDGILGDRVTDN